MTHRRRGRLQDGRTTTSRRAGAAPVASPTWANKGRPERPHLGGPGRVVGRHDERLLGDPDRSDVGGQRRPDDLLPAAEDRAELARRPAARCAATSCVEASRSDRGRRARIVARGRESARRGLAHGAASLRRRRRSRRRPAMAVGKGDRRREEGLAAGQLARAAPGSGPGRARRRRRRAGASAAGPDALGDQLVEPEPERQGERTAARPGRPAPGRPARRARSPGRRDAARPSSRRAAGPRFAPRPARRAEVALPRLLVAQAHATASSRPSDERAVAAAASRRQLARAEPRRDADQRRAAAAASRSSHTSRVASTSAVRRPPAWRRSAVALAERPARRRRARAGRARSSNRSASSSRSRRRAGPPWTTARSSGENTVTGTASARSARAGRLAVHLGPGLARPG